MRDKRLEVKKVHGTQNPAGIITKPKSAEEVVDKIAGKHMGMIEREVRETTNDVGANHVSLHFRSSCGQ